MKKAGALLLVAVLTMGACAGSESKSEDPKATLISAMEKTGQAEGLTFTLSLQSTPESLDAIAQDDGGAPLPEEDAEKILASSITVSTKGSGEDGSFEMVMDVAGEGNFEMKAIDKVLYLRADVEALVETFGGDPAEIESGVAQAEAQGLTFARPAAEGKWISISGLQETLGQMTGQTPPAVPEQEQLIQDLTDSFKENATVSSEGQEDAGEHLVVSVPLRDTYENFVEDFSELTQQIPAGQLPPASEVPDEEVKLDVWVDDEQVTQIVFDLIQVARITNDEEVPEDIEQFGLLAKIEEFDEEIEVPEDVTAIDPQQILGIFGGLLGGMQGSATESAPAGDVGAGFNCDDLKGAPPEVLAQFAEECPELQP